MNVKGSGSGRNSPHIGNKSISNGGSSSTRRSNRGDNSEAETENMEESGLSEEDDEEEEEEHHHRPRQIHRRGSNTSSTVMASRSNSNTVTTRNNNRRRNNSLNKNLDDEELEESSDEDDQEEGIRDDDEDDDDEEEEEDSSDMDGQECEKKRFEYIEDLTDLEKQFAILREQLYRERMAQIESKLEEVRAGRAQEYLQPLEELQVNMKNRMETGTILKQYRMANIHCKYDAEMLAAEQNFKSEKELLWDSIKADLDEKIHMLEEDKHNVDFTSGLWEMNSGKSRKRKADPMDPDRRKKPVTISGPYIVYMLHEADIIDDWAAIKKSNPGRKKH